MPSIRRLSLAVALSTFMLLGACATTPHSPAEQDDAAANNDPFETVNRGIFDFNDFMDRLLIRPLAELYRVTVPPPLRDRVANILSNMSEPVTFANNVMQWKLDSAGMTLERFAVNTSLGVGGVFEVANGFGIPQQHGDFGQTLHSWGVGSGPYIVLPFFGPSNIRDAIGLGVDTAMSPWQYLAALGGNGTYNRFTGSDIAASALTRREQAIEPLDALRQGSLDFYAQMRSVYRQHRAMELGEASNDMPEFDDYGADSSKSLLQ